MCQVSVITISLGHHLLDMALQQMAQPQMQGQYVYADHQRIYAHQMQIKLLSYLHHPRRTLHLYVHSSFVTF